MATDEPLRRSFEIKNKAGLHARAAKQVVELTKRYAAEVSVSKDGQTVNGKSILGLMMLAAAKGQAIEITAEGPQANDVLDAMGELIERLFDEEE